MLKSVEIKNFRSCYDTKLELDGSICALSGKNGVGKSNILKAIEWACTSVLAPEAIRTGLAGNHDTVVETISVTLRVELSVGLYEYELILPHTNALSRDHSSALNGIRERLTILERGGATSRIFDRVGEIIMLSEGTRQIRIHKSTPALPSLFSLLMPLEPVAKHADYLIEFFRGVKYYSPDDKTDAGSYVTEQQYNEWRFRYQAEGELSDSIAMRLIYMWQKDRELFGELILILGPQGINLIDSISIASYPAVIPENARPGEKDFKTIYLPLIMPSEVMGGAGRTFQLSDLSVGTRRILQIVTSILFDKRSLILMEQPEDSIHSALLRKLIDIIRSYSDKTQILFTTHSLEVLDILRPEEILLATANNGKTEVRKLNPDELERAKNFLKHDGTLSDFLEAQEAL